MDENRQLFINELSPEETEILRLSNMLRKMGKDPVKILKLSIDAGATLDKVVTLGKDAKGFLKDQWNAFEREFKKAKDGE